MPSDHRAGVLHRRAGHRRGEHRLAEDLARIETTAAAQDVLGVGEPRHLFEVRSGDAAAIGAHGRHHLELFVDDHEELFGLLRRAQELGQRLGRRPSVRVAERPRDRVHRDDPVDRADVRLGAGSDSDVPGRHDREGPIRPALVLEESAEPRERGGGGIRPHTRGEVAPDDEVRSLAASDLISDHATDDVGVFLVGNVEAGVVECDRCTRQSLEHLVEGHCVMVGHDQAAQGSAVIVADEPALAHLTVRHQREDLARGARGIRQGDVCQQVDVHDITREHLDGCAVAGDQGERDAAISEIEDRGYSAGHRRSFVVGAVAQRRRPPEGGLFRSKHRLKGGPPGAVREHAPNLSQGGDHPRAASRSQRGGLVPPPHCLVAHHDHDGRCRDDEERRPDGCSDAYCDHRHCKHHDSGYEQPDVKGVELPQQEAVESEERNFRTRGQGLLHTRGQMSESTCASWAITWAATWRPAPTPTSDPKSTMCP